MAASTGNKLLAEGLGTALLLAVVVGSGIMAERLSGGNAAIALLANTLATVGGLYILIEVFGPISGAHFNPAVSAVMATRGAMAWSLLEVAPMLLRTQTGAAMEISLPLGRREVLKAWPVFQSWTDDRDSRTSH